MVTMQDPFRPNSNAQLMREAQIGFIVIGLLLCVLIYVAFYRLTNRSSRFDEISRNVAVAEPIDSDPYQAHSVVPIEQKREERLASDKKGAFAASDRFSSMVKPSRLQQPSPDEKVAQATHMSSRASSENSTKKPAPAALPFPKVIASPFVPAAKQIPNKHIPKAPRPFESLSGRADFEATEGSGAKKLPRKQPKVGPPVLKSKFGGTPAQDFIQAPISKKAEIKTDSASFEVLPPRPLKVKTNSASHFLPSKPKPPAAGSIDKALTRQLPASTTKDQSTDFMPQTATSRKQFDSKKIDFGQSNKSPVIAQTSAFELVKAAPVPLPEPSKKFGKTSAKVGKTYSTKTGDSLWTIAQAVYGDGRYFRALHEMNHDTLSLSDSIPAGTLLMVSSIEEVRKDYPDLCPKQEKKTHLQDVSVAANANQKLDDGLDHRFYRTENGDTLFEIARQRLGQASRYLEIYELNRFRIPETANHLTPLGGGIELLLPQ